MQPGSGGGGGLSGQGYSVGGGRGGHVGAMSPSLYAAVCCRMLPFADVCWRMLTYAVLTYADVW
jgi:hypothetical protein